MFSIVSIAHAAVDMTQFSTVVSPIISNIVNPVVWLMFAVATVVFVYGVLQMVIKGNDPEARKTGQMSILYGVIGMFIMFSAWGIIYLISNTVKGI
ncbi:MAG: hypothetical protein WCO48_01810 [Candidatus Taylorbacteria bacterium]